MGTRRVWELGVKGFSGRGRLVFQGRSDGSHGIGSGGGFIGRSVGLRIYGGAGSGDLAFSSSRKVMRGFGLGFQVLVPHTLCVGRRGYAG